MVKESFGLVLGKKMARTTIHLNYQTRAASLIPAKSVVIAVLLLFNLSDSATAAEPDGITSSRVNSTFDNTNNKTATSETRASLMGREFYLIFFTVFFSCIVIFGSVGNFLVVATPVFWSDMRSPCNSLIANIAIADFLVAIFVTPLRIWELYVGWPLGKWGCYVLFPVQDVLVAVSVVTHTALALERRRAMVSPFKPKLSFKKVKYITVGMWLACIALLGIPELVPVQFAKWQGRAYCWPDWPSVNHRRAFEMYLVLVFIALPLVVQCFAYGHAVHVQRRTENLDAFGTESSSSREFVRHRIKQKRKLVKMLTVMMAIFQVSYISRGVIMLTYEFAPWLKSSLVYEFASTAVLVLFYLKHVANPVFLWFMSKDFHNCFIAIFTCDVTIQRSVAKRVSNLTETMTVQSKVTRNSIQSGVGNDAVITAD